VEDVCGLNKRKVRLFVEAVWNEGRLELIDALLAADYAGHFPCLAQAALGREDMRGLVESRRRAHPGLWVKIEDQVAEDDRVVTRWQATTGAASADAGGYAPFCSGISIIRLLAGKQVDSHTELTSLAGEEAAA